MIKSTSISSIFDTLSVNIIKVLCAKPWPQPPTSDIIFSPTTKWAFAKQFLAMFCCRPSIKDVLIRGSEVKEFPDFSDIYRLHEMRTRWVQNPQNFADIPYGWPPTMHCRWMGDLPRTRSCTIKGAVPYHTARNFVTFGDWGGPLEGRRIFWM